MSKIARGLRVGAVVIGVAALMSACAQTGDEDTSMMEQTRADAQAAEAAADRATEAADRAAAAAAEAADAASAAQMSAERQDRMMQQTMRK
jgi:hypothetical protein